ncbi:hypothetical protein O181_012445 [Austropuccinia psidii MF-1]|uniref:Uncharacterized protein n=1 Tax=Austropuccinia psidii MF-1 TaxID=1389203 RepID=A0A9Q3BX43_9BASI|nr:hypothetical protein [Austropuccinia psidii MF-1]
MFNMKVLRKCGGILENVIKLRFVEPFSTEEYIKEMEEIISRTRIGETWIRNLMESKIIRNTYKEYRRSKRPVLKCKKCGSTFHLAKVCTKRTKINEVQLMEEVQCAEEKEKYDQDSEISDDTPAEDYPIENITAFFEVTEVYTHLPQYSKDCLSLIIIQEDRM